MDPNESDLEPMARIRSNTWPQRPSREVEPNSSPVGGDEASSGAEQQGGAKDPLGLTAKKSGSRRNAWGNLSYADLITKAIQSSPEKRLTLSQIYDWMVQNVPYFKDKGDSTSSAGWKNSIRHNLSLHSRFMRIQNEGTGKSSWWVLNPDAKPGKTPRRRAGSMETKCYEKKRGRVRKKAEALRTAMENGETLSPVECDDISDVLGFGGDFRSRTSSDASSIGHPAADPDLHDNQVPPMSPIPWESEVCGSPTLGEPFTDLISLAVAMKLSGQEVTGITDIFQTAASRDFSNQSSPYMDINQPSPVMENQFNHLPAPPPYPKQQQQQVNGVDFYNSNYITPLRLQCNTSPGGKGSAYQQSDIFEEDFQVLNVKQEAEGLSPVHLPATSSLSLNTQLSSPDRSQQGSPNTGSFTRLSPQSQPGLNSVQLQLSPLTIQVSPQQNRHLVKQEPIPVSPAHTQQQALHQTTRDSILREALTKGPPAYRSQPTANTSPQVYTTLTNHSSLNALQNQTGINEGITLTLNSNLSPLHQAVTAGQLCGINDENFTHHIITTNGVVTNNPGIPLDIDMDFMGMSGLDYDMDQVIKQELNLEGTLDFNFDTAAPTSINRSVVH